MTNVTLTLTIEQAQSVSKALDLYNRVCIGQINEISQLVRVGIIPLGQECTRLPIKW